MDDHERQLIDMINLLQLEHEQRLRPWLNRLAFIRSLRPPAPILMGTLAGPDRWAAPSGPITPTTT